MSAATLVNGVPGESVPVADRGLHYGDGLFETISCRGGRPRWLPLHLERLELGCERLGIEPPAPATLAREIAALAGGSEACIVKLILTRGVAVGRGYRPTGTERATRILARHDWPAPTGAAWRLGLSPVRLASNPLLAGLKHLNRLEQVLAQRERPAGCDEVLMCAATGAVISGSMSNLFLVEGDRLVTPPLDECGIAGVMRRLVLECAPAAGWRTAVETVSRERLRAAAAVFVTNVRLGLMPVAACDAVAYPLPTGLGRLMERIDARAH